MNKGLRVSKIVSRFEKITLEVNKLSLEANALTHKIKALSEQKGAVKTDCAVVNKYKIGDEVEITNSYHGKRGTKGTVTQVTKSLVTLHDGTGKQHTRKHTNLKKL